MKQWLNLLSIDEWFVSKNFCKGVEKSKKGQKGANIYGWPCTYCEFWKKTW